MTKRKRRPDQIVLPDWAADPEQVAYFTCDYCGAEFKVLRDFIAHSESQHQKRVVIKPPSDTISRYSRKTKGPCPVCGRMSDDLLHHIQELHAYDTLDNNQKRVVRRIIREAAHQLSRRHVAHRKGKKTAPLKRVKVVPGGGGPGTGKKR